MNRVKPKKPSKGYNCDYPPDDGRHPQWAYNHVCVDCREVKRFGQTRRPWGYWSRHRPDTGEYRKGDGLTGPRNCPKCGEKMMEIRRLPAPAKRDQWWTRPSTLAAWEKHKWKPYFVVEGPGTNEERFDEESEALARGEALSESTPLVVRVRKVKHAGRKGEVRDDIAVFRGRAGKTKSGKLMRLIKKSLRASKGRKLVRVQLTGVNPYKRGGLLDLDNAKVPDIEELLESPSRLVKRTRGDNPSWRWVDPQTEVIYTLTVFTEKYDPLIVLAGVAEPLWEQWRRVS